MHQIAAPGQWTDLLASSSTLTSVVVAVVVASITAAFSVAACIFRHRDRG